MTSAAMASAAMVHPRGEPRLINRDIRVAVTRNASPTLDDVADGGQARPTRVAGGGSDS